MLFLMCLTWHIITTSLVCVLMWIFSICVCVYVQRYFLIHVAHRCRFSNLMSWMTQIFTDENICDLCMINGASAAHKSVRVKHNTVISGLLADMKVRKWGVTSFFSPQLIYAILIILFSSFLTSLNAAYAIVIHPHHTQFGIPAQTHDCVLVCNACLEKATQDTFHCS